MRLLYLSILFLQCINIPNTIFAMDNGVGDQMAKDMAKICGSIFAVVAAIPLCAFGFSSDDYRPTTCGFLSFLSAITTVYLYKNGHPYFATSTAGTSFLFASIGYSEHQKLQRKNKNHKHT